MRPCPRCGHPNDAAARFCSSCGAPLDRACASCGSALEDGARFCGTCGAAVDPPDDAASSEERKIVTVLFADVTGSTTLGERLDPEHLREVMQTYFAAMRREIEAEGGTVEKFIGDAVMAAFGVPVAHENDPARALRAALRMRGRLPSVNEDLAAAHGVTLEVRIGVNTGEVLATTDPKPGEAMVTGDAVNAAARLQAAASPGEIVASERTVRATRGFAVDDLGQLELRGKAVPVRAFRVLDEEGGPAAERGVPGLSAPLVGRRSELDVLRSVFDRVRSERRPTLVTIYGEAGVGKSRLTREFVAQAEATEPRTLVLRGRCLPYGEGVTFWPLAEILKAHAGVLDSDPAALALEKIRKAGRDVFADAGSVDPARATAALAYTVGVEDPELPLSAKEPRQVHHEVHDAWRAYFSALATDRPVIAVVEDIHWADAALLDLLDELAERAEGPLLLVCPSRPDLTATRPSWGGGRRNHTSIALDPLSAEDARSLVSELLAVDDLPDRVRGKILERAEGNAFFLEEIVRQLIDEGRITHDGIRWRAATDLDDVVIPDTVQSVLAARIDLLDPPDKRVAQAAAVVGRVFWPGPVADLTGMAPAEVDGALRRLEARELVVSRLSSTLAGEPELIFKHVLTRDVAYDGLPRRERSVAHEGVATWIESTAGERRSEVVEILAGHLEAALLDRPTAAGTDEGSLRRRALEVLLEASEDARRRFALGKARSLGERALAIAERPLDRARGMTRLGEIALTDYRGDDAWTLLREAADLRVAHAPDDRLAIAAVCGRAVEAPTRWPGSMTILVPEHEIASYIELGFANLPPGDSEERTRLLIARSFHPFANGSQRELSDEELRDAEAAGLEASEQAMRLGRPDLASTALDAAASVPGSRGLFGRMKEINERRLPLVESLRDDPIELQDIYSMNAWCSAYIGDLRPAREQAELGARISGAATTSVGALSWLAFAEFCLGNWDRVIDEIQPEIEGRLGDRADRPPYFTVPAFGSTALILVARGSTRAERYVEVLTRSAGEALGYSTGVLDAWGAWTMTYRGRTDEARSMLDRVSGPARRGPSRPFFEQVAATVLGDADAWGEVPAHLEATRAYAREAGLVALPAHLDRLEGRMHLAVGDRAEAIERFEAASSTFAAIGASWEGAATDLLTLGALDPDRRPPARVETARAVFERVGSKRELEELEELEREAGPG